MHGSSGSTTVVLMLLQPHKHADSILPCTIKPSKVHSSPKLLEVSQKCCQHGEKQFDLGYLGQGLRGLAR